jgi:hypothetical protein
LYRYNEDGNKVSGSRMRRVDIVKGFELDVRYAKVGLYKLNPVVTHVA